MIIFRDKQPDTIITRLDPRVRIVSMLAFAFSVVTLTSPMCLSVAVGIATASLVLSGLPLRHTMRRLTSLNILCLGLLVLVPLSTPGTQLIEWHGWAWTEEGVAHVLRIISKANAILIFCNAFVSTLEPPQIGYALDALRLPKKMTQIFLFMIRYIETIHVEYHRLRHAMKLRGFKATMNMHSLRALGYLIGMLFLRSLNRAERIGEAMRCRGFHGELYTLHKFLLRRNDVAFAVSLFVFLSGIIFLDRGGLA